MITCPNCKQQIAAAGMRVSVFYMHDNHTFTRLTGSVDEMIEQARALGVESPHGMLGAARIVDSDGRDVRRLGESIHARVGFDESDLHQWKQSLLADDDARQLIGGAP